MSPAYGCGVENVQSIYGWRLADVRRLLGLADEALPGLRRVDLEVNYRCPAVVLDRAVRLVEHNDERFSKVIRARDGATGSLILAPTSVDDLDRAAAVLGSWGSPVPDVPASVDQAAAPTFAILARTNRELMPATIAALQAGQSFRFAGTIPLEAPELDEILRQVEALDASLPLLVRLGRTRARGDAAEGHRPAGGTVDAGGSAMDGPGRDTDAGTAGWDEIVGSMLGWAAGYRDLEAFRAAIEDARGRLAALRRDDAALSLATAHGTKGLEFDHVAVVGMDAGRFPSARSVAEAVEPERALEEERRLAYVAWTRARRSLTLVYDPEAPSPFLLEAFTPDELGVESG